MMAVVDIHGVGTPWWRWWVYTVWVHHGGGGGYIWCGYTMMAVVGIYGVGRHVNDLMAYKKITSLIEM